jgi:hypothetical protein
MVKQKPAQAAPVVESSPRLTQQELHSLLDEARKERERVATFGGDKVGVTLSMLLLDLLFELKEQNAQARSALALAHK